jgi:predicted deacetylase
MSTFVLLLVSAGFVSAMWWWFFSLASVDSVRPTIRCVTHTAEESERRGNIVVVKLSVVNVQKGIVVST